MKMTFFILMLTSVLFCFTGCSEEQLNQADAFVQDVNSIAAAVQPVSAAVPGPWGLYLLLASNVITSGAALWEKIRKDLVNKKYTAMKTGQKQFILENPDVGQKLFEIVGVERTSAGL